MDYRKRLEEIHGEFKERESSFLRQFQEGAPVNMVLHGLWGRWEREALYYLIILKDLSHAKQCFYTCGRIDEYLIRRYDARTLHYGVDHVSYAVLSDCEPLIQRYSRLRDSLHEEMKPQGGVYCLAMQHLMVEDWKGLEEDIPIFRKLAQKKDKWSFFTKLHLQYHEAMLEKRLDKVEAILREFEKPENLKKRSLGGLIPEFISHPTLGYAKLAWRCGLEVEVGSPLVPQALLPVQPLAQYEEAYDFLTELET